MLGTTLWVLVFMAPFLACAANVGWNAGEAFSKAIGIAGQVDK